MSESLAIGDVRMHATTTGDAFEPPAIIDWALVLSHAGRTPILTHHRIQALAGKPQIGPGTPVDRALAQQLLESLRDAGSTPEGWITPAMLYRSESTLVWFSPAKVRPMYFRMGEQARLSLRVPWPSLVFVARASGALEVHAVKGSARPTPATRLYHAPLANIFADGRLCWGTIAPPRFAAASIPAWEAAVHRTYFTTPNHERTHRGRGELLALWRRLHAEKAQAFPAAALAPCGKTLEDSCGA